MTIILLRHTESIDKIMLSILHRKAALSSVVCATSTAKVIRCAASFSLSTLSDGEEEDCHEQQPSQQVFPTKNVRLEAIKSVGITQLHNTTQDLIARTRQPLFEENPLDAHGQKKQSIAQIQESNRLEKAIIDAVAHYSSKHNTFLVGGQCIDVLGVEVSHDLKQAKAYWCLPRSLDLHNIPQPKLELLVKKVQKRLDERGGKIQGLVHTKLRAYYPPRIVWVAAEHVSKDLKRWR